jgi:Icc-related predicted phosphoesterase
MKVQIVSDLHMEFGDYNFTAAEATTELLLLAGDIHVSPRSFVKAIKQLGPVPKVMVLGNHEYYGKDINKAVTEYRVAAIDSARKTAVLDDEATVINGVRIVGCTLWTDYMNMEWAEDCRPVMNDFIAIRDKGKNITPRALFDKHKASLKYLEGVLSTPFKGKTIVLTHHAPSFQSVALKFQGSRLNGAFVSNLEWMIEKYSPEFWVHGHCHTSSDYTLGKTRVICNPHGYGRDENPKFKPALVLDI